MSSQVFIEEHLDHYLKSLINGQSYIPGVIIGQVRNGNYFVVHLSAIPVWHANLKNNINDVLSFKTITEVINNSDTIFEKSLDVVKLLPGGSYVLGLFFIIPHDVKSVQPPNLNFNEFSQRLNEYQLCKGNNKTWDYLLLNYSTVSKKSFCFTVDYDSSKGLEKVTYRSIDTVIGLFDNGWVTLVGKFNFGTLDLLNIAGGPKTLFSIRDNLLDEFESILNQSLCTFNGCVYDEHYTLEDLKCDTIGNSLKNVVNIEFYKEVELGRKKASLSVVRGKGKVLMSGLCSLAVPFNRKGTIKDAIKAIHEDAIQTFATRLKLHLDSFVEEESVEDEEGDANVVHETPRRVLIIKTDGSRFAFSDYVFPGEDPQESLFTALFTLHLSEEKMVLYDMLEKGRHSNYETLPDIDSTPQQVASTVTSSKNKLIYFTWAALILAIIAFVVKQFFI